MIRFFSLFLSAFVTTASFAQSWPMPGATWEPETLCQGCPGDNNGTPNDGLPTAAYSLPFADHVGRYVDSSTTASFVNGMNTVRAGRSKLSPDGTRLYTALGNAVGVYDVETFMSERLLEPMVTVDALVTGSPYSRGGEPLEKIAMPDAFVFPAASQSGWNAYPINTSQIIADFDSDDRGYLYVSWQFGGWGIHQDDGRTDGTHLPFVARVDDATINPKSILAFHQGDRYYVIVAAGNAATSQLRVYDVTIASAPTLVTTRSADYFKFNAWTKDEVHQRLAYLADGAFHVFSYAGFLAGDPPQHTGYNALNGLNDLKFDEAGRLWALSFGPQLFRLTWADDSPTPITTNYTIDSVRPGSFDVAGGVIAIAGTDSFSGPTVVLATVDNDGVPAGLDSGDFFRRYYHEAPTGYAQAPASVTLGFPKIITAGSKTYLLYGAGGLGDVYRFDDGSAAVNSVSPRRGPPAGGTTITIFGRNLGTSPVVRMGGTVVSSSVTSATTVEAVTPPHAPGAVEVTLEGDTGTAALPRAFTYEVPMPADFHASQDTSTSIRAEWSASVGASQYQLQRRNPDGTWLTIAMTPSLSFVDGGRAAGSAHVYRVRALDSSNYSSAYTEPDVATTLPLTTLTISSGMPVMAAHLSDLRLAVGAIRSAASLPAASFDETIAAGTTIRATHVSQLRSLLTEARSTLGLPAVSFTDSDLTSQPMKAVHLQELIDASH